MVSSANVNSDESLIHNDSNAIDLKGSVDRENVWKNWSHVIETEKVQFVKNLFFFVLICEEGINK